MKMNRLGRTDILVSEICLGTMTWGSQNTREEAYQQMDYALDHGVNFFDTAELYPTTPLSAETYADTERLIGDWFEKTGKRDKVVLATKVAGPGRPYIREGKPITGAVVKEAVDASLKRLKTDYIDLYQIHWPNRGHFHFRGAWSYNPFKQDRSKASADIAEILEALGDCVKAGKLKAIGLSNETTWGTQKYLTLAEAKGLPRVATIQNEYNLLYRHYDLDLAELSHHEDVGLLAYSPLAGGILSGKYLDGKKPAGSRGSINGDIGGRLVPQQEAATRAYVELAKANGIDPSAMALAFCLTRPFMASVIIGATTMDQLKVNIGAADLKLSDEVLQEIAKIHRQYPMPI
ncbi:aryl-alcohol dehydrogenase-like predicted oxidoreductase [Rhizobium rosettiformans]|uniref:Aldo/keto reductase n=2 Tax=Rhizobium rosettiformans TaxID=1368430 RepID=A0A4S8Q2F1_9HYPH|nr:aldo/keto reductase [Rhizobium rosettiformans]MBB5274079.1 aryl-alcohol dehydrogenase-like predicted oxidoreductase [Rhizobium rosettiformans]THV38258.1 aldo/keto reductase [Rhizobium rosettiformans W3]